MKRAIWILAALLVLYVGAYLVLLHPVPSLGPRAAVGFPDYRIGRHSFDSPAVFWMFYPLQQLDVRLRPSYWMFSLAEQDQWLKDLAKEMRERELRGEY